MATSEQSITNNLDVIANAVNEDTWSLDCEFIIEEMDTTIQEIKVSDIALSGGIYLDESLVNIDFENNNVLDLDVNVVIDGVNSQILESQVVPYADILEITEFSPEASNEKRFASSAFAAKSIYDFASLVDNKADTIGARTASLTDRVRDIEEWINNLDLSGEGGGDSFWELDDDGNLVTKKGVVIQNNLVVEGDTSSSGEGENTGGGGNIILDEEMSDTSENGVQNKVIKAYVDSLFGRVDVSDLREWKNALSQKFYLGEDGNIYCDTNLIVRGDTSSNGTGQDTPSGGGIDFEELEDYLTNEQYAQMPWISDNFNPIIDINNKLSVDLISGLYDWAKQPSLRLQDVPDLSSLYLSTSGGEVNGDVTINGNLIVKGDTSSGGTGQDTPSGGGSDVSFIQTQTSGTKIGTLTIDGVSTGLFVGKTLGNASEKGVVDRASAYALSTSTNLVTERAVYYGLARINEQSQTRNVSIYAPTTEGDSGQFLKSTGNGAPIWTKIDRSTIGLGNVANINIATWSGSSNLTTCAQGTIIGSNNIGSQSVNYATSASNWSYSALSPNADTLGNIHGWLNKDSGAINIPTDGADAGTIVSFINGSAGLQLFSSYRGDTNSSPKGIYFRKQYSGTWDGWKEFVVSGLKQTVSGEKTFSSAVKYTEFVASQQQGTGTNDTGNFRFGRFDENGGLKLQFGASSNAKFEIVDSAWKKALFAVNTEADCTIGRNLVVTGDASSGSDIRFKDVIENKTIRIDDIANAPLFSFKWNDREEDALHLGTSAQYWEERVPELVSGSNFKTLNYAALGVAMGVSLAKKSVNHEDRIKVLEDEIKVLNQELRRIKDGICNKL